MRINHIMTGTQPSFKRKRDRLWLAAIAGLLTVSGSLAISTTAAADPAPGAKDWNWVSNDMVTGRLTARFGSSLDPFNAGQTRDHHGIDIAAPTGTPIYAPADGWVREATTLYKGKPAYGTVVVLETAGGITTVFTHLDAFDVQIGQTVQKGDKIASVGSTGKSTGPHVHIETYRNGERVDPMTVWEIKS